MPSTVICRVKYSVQRRELMVEFVTGRRYVYLNVPEEKVTAMRAAFAKGRYFNAYIRDHYRFRELTADEERATVF